MVRIHQKRPNNQSKREILAANRRRKRQTSCPGRQTGHGSGLLIRRLGVRIPPGVPLFNVKDNHKVAGVHRHHLPWACRLISRTRDFESRGGGAEPPGPSTFGSVAKQKSTSFIRERFGGANPPRATSFGSIAQLAERLAHNQGVVGS